MAHTFVTAITKGQGVVKPTRENDFTRFLTNAKVVLLFAGDGGGSTAGEQEVTKLTKERKVGQGPGGTIRGPYELWKILFLFEITCTLYCRWLVGCNLYISYAYEVY